MRVGLRLDQLDSHAHFAIFVDGGKAGDLCLRREEYFDFRDALQRGCTENGHAFQLTDNRKEQPR